MKIREHVWAIIETCIFSESPRKAKVLLSVFVRDQTDMGRLADVFTSDEESALFSLHSVLVDEQLKERVKHEGN